MKLSIIKDESKMSISKHNEEIHRNLACWREKALLRMIYKNFYNIIEQNLAHDSGSYTVEIGSGIGNIKEFLPNCVTTDLFANPWIDRIENAYQLSFADNTVSNLILFDIFHHLRYPGTALKEFNRVLSYEGRVIILDPCISLLGCIVFGLFHHEKLGLRENIEMFAPSGWTFDNDNYYAAQGNASRIFGSKRYKSFLHDLEIIKKKKLSAISYVTSGGYSKPQLYPDKAYFIMKFIDRICDLAPILFATRFLVVLQKKKRASC